MIIDNDFAEIYLKMEENENLNNEELKYLLYKVIESSLTTEERAKIYSKAIDMELERVERIYTRAFSGLDESIYNDYHSSPLNDEISFSDYERIYDEKIRPQLKSNKCFQNIYCYMDYKCDYFYEEMAYYKNNRWVINPLAAVEYLFCNKKLQMKMKRNYS